MLPFLILFASELYDHNKGVMDSLQKGDAVEFNRGIFSHWALYIGDWTVIHLTGVEDDSCAAVDPSSVFSIGGQSFTKAWVKMDNFFYVARGSKARRNNENNGNLQVKPVDEIIATARNMVGEVGYNLLWNNCEHFVNYCRYGHGTSKQVTSWATDLGVLVGALVIIAFYYWVLLTRRRNAGRIKRD